MAEEYDDEDDFTVLEFISGGQVSFTAHMC